MILDQRIAVVTGASSGIGAATARLLASRGAKVALLARRTDRLDALADEIVAAGGDALAVAADTTDPITLAAAAERIGATYGAADLIVNNAGVMLPSAIQARNTTDWRREVDVNVSGVLNVIDAFLPGLLEAAASGRPADLVNMSSMTSHVVFPYMAVYNATKAAVSHLSRTMRTELGPQGVRVTVVEPAMTATELQGHVVDEGINAWVAQAREAFTWLDPNDVAEVVAFTTSRPAHVTLSQVVVYPTRQA
ncbi:SDR family NAD(P)-dependent oxidoreductase [Microbacterium bovistercoris]|uniref:SDR family NAD(P)-dependent oxidoreductase n=1 Tax=Microbacterium bovistercoris TaxID=2293570 RepID=A0A371NR72_9MICO|nr:SDR family oxidoreductase [Microbacterium bovistercoris]REJ04135.1 SDR family NAD(P)-dependent oxidoreductase [Microbacterium bovistercoris]